MKAEDGLFYRNDKEEIVADPNVALVPKSVEGSNVSAVATMANILDLSRQYEVQVKLMKHKNSKPHN